MYGTLINGNPVPAPNPLHIGGKAIYNPPDDAYAAAGYLPITDTPHPDVSDSDAAPYYESSWTEQDGQIVRVWTETEPPPPDPVRPTAEERISALEAAVLTMMGGDMDV